MDQIVIDRIDLHIPGGALNVHQNHGNTFPCRDPGHFWIEPEGADIVDDGRPGLQCLICHFSLTGVYANGDGNLFMKRLYDRNNPVHLFGSRDFSGIWAGGFSSDVDDVCALSSHIESMFHGLVCVKITTPV